MARIADGERGTVGLAVLVVLSATVAGKVAGFVDDCTSLGVGSKSRGGPEHRAEVDSTESIRVDEGYEGYEWGVHTRGSNVPYTPARVQVQSYRYPFGLPDWIFL